MRQVPGRLLHGRVDVGQGRLDVEQQDRVEVHRLDDDDACKAVLAEPVDARGGVEAEITDEGGERPEGAQDGPQTDRPDERREHQRHQQQPAQQRPAGELELDAEDRQGQGDDEAEQGGRDADHGRIAEPADQRRVGQDELEVLERESASGSAEALGDDVEDRPDEEQGEKDQQGPGQDEVRGAGPGKAGG